MDSSSRLEREIARNVAKQTRRAALGFSQVSTQRQLEKLRTKRQRVLNHLAWNLANDVVDHSLPGEAIAYEDNRFNQGLWASASLRLATEHVAKRRGRVFSYYSAFQASHTCPCCGAATTPDGERFVSCDCCDWVGDRDYTGAVLGAVRVMRRALGNRKFAAKPDRTKVEATPRRPVKVPRVRRFIGAGSDAPGRSNKNWGGRTCTSVAPAVPTVEQSFHASIVPAKAPQHDEKT